MVTDLSPKAAEILACARSLLSQRGYNGFSYADISDAVGISKASVHHHFASKAALVRSVLVDYRASAVVGLAALDQQFPDPLARLQHWVGWWHACLRERTLPFCVCAMLATEMPAIPPEVSVEVRGHFDDLSAWLARALESGAATGQLRLESAPTVEALALMAAIHGAMVSARAYDDPDVFASVTGSVIRRLSAVA
jgi:TetR/AcrR family transcriptional repressor of nem operon